MGYKIEVHIFAKYVYTAVFSLLSEKATFCSLLLEWTLKLLPHPSLRQHLEGNIGHNKQLLVRCRQQWQAAHTAMGDIKRKMLEGIE